MPIRVVWLGGDANRRMAAALKDAGLIDDYEATPLSTILIIDRDEITITVRDLAGAMERAGIRADVDELRGVWPHLWLGVMGGEVVELGEEHVKLKAKEPRKVLSVRVPESLYEAIRKKAEDEGTTMTDIVIRALKAYL